MGKMEFRLFVRERFEFRLSGTRGKGMLFRIYRKIRVERPCLEPPESRIAIVYETEWRTIAL